MTKKAGEAGAAEAEATILREFTEEVSPRGEWQMLLDGHSAASVAERLGLAGTNLLYRWKREQLERCTGPVATLRLKPASTNWKSSCTASSADATF